MAKGSLEDRPVPSRLLTSNCHMGKPPRQKNASPPFTRPKQTSSLGPRAPPELLSAILIEICAAVDNCATDTVQTRTQTRLNLAGVCNYWRAVAHACPQLWTYLALDPACLRTERVARANLTRLKICLARAKACPLDIIFDLTIMPPAMTTHGDGEGAYDTASIQHFLKMLTWQVEHVLSPWLESLAEYIPQWRTFEWSSNHFDHQNLISVLFEGITSEVEATLLESVHIRHDAKRQLICELPGLDFVAPRLRRVNLKSVDVNWATASILRGLTTLSLDGTSVDYCYGDVEIPPPPAILLAILEACPGLISLSLEEMAPDNWTLPGFPNKSIRLGNLATLQLDAMSSPFMLALLTRVAVPAVRELILSTTDEDVYPALVELHRTGQLDLSQIIKLSLDQNMNQPNPMGAQSFFALLTHMEELDFDCWKFQLDALRHFHCPRLRRLTVHLHLDGGWTRETLYPLALNGVRVDTLVVVATAGFPLSDGMRAAILNDEILRMIARNLQVVEKRRDWDGFLKDAERSAWWGVLERVYEHNLAVVSDDDDDAWTDDDD